MDEKDFLSQFQVVPMIPLTMLCNLYDSERCIQEKKIQENCEHIEWEQDMGAHIPFCKLYGKVCDTQCTKGFFNGR